MQEEQTHVRNRYGPRPSLDAAKDALNGFLNAVDRARDDFGISDVVLIATCPYLVDRGMKREFIYSASGDPSHFLGMATYAYGFERKRQESEIERLINQGSQKA